MPIYSVGTVFLQVAPSFDGLQHEARRHANAAGRDMAQAMDKHLAQAEKAAAKRGRQTAEQYTGEFDRNIKRSVKRAQDAFSDLGDTPGLTRAAKALTRLSKIKIDPSMTKESQAKILRDIDLVRDRMRRVVDDPKNMLRFRVDAGAIVREMEGIDKQMRTLLGATEQGVRRAWVEQYRARAEMERDFQQRAAAAEKARRTEELTHIRATGEDRRRTESALQASQKAFLAERKRAIADEMSALRLQRDDIARSIRALRSESDVNVRVAGKAKALADIAQVERAMDDLAGEGRRLGFNVNTTSDIIALRRLKDAVGDVGEEAVKTGFAMRLLDAGSAANSVRVFNGLLLATVAIGPALIPILGGIAAGIIGIGGAAAGAIFGIGILAAALSGIGGAVGALGDLDKARRNAAATPSSPGSAASGRGLESAQLSLARAREDAGRRIAAAARQEAQAERSLADARIEAAQAMDEALDRQIEAQRRLTDAQEAARDAQRELNDAREEATRQLEDMNAQLAGAADRERRAEIALQEAQVHLNALLEDDQATGREIELAQLDVRDAVRDLEEVRRENQRLAEDTAEANARGVEGSDQVTAAKERQADASRAVRDAEDALADAQQAIRDQAVTNAREIADAEEDLRLAREASAIARVEEARTLADAERAVTNAMQDMAFAATSAGGAATTAMNNLREAMLGLSPAGQAFALFLYGLKPLLDDLRFAAQEGLLPGLQQAITTIVDVYGPSFVKFLGSISKVSGDLFVKLADMFTNPFWQEWFSLMAQYAPIFLTQFADISMNLLTFIAGVLEAFAPFSKEIGDAFVAITAAWAEWAANLSASEGFAEFLAYLREAAPLVGEFLLAFFAALVNLMIGLAPWAELILVGLTSFFEFLAGMDPQLLGNIVVGILLLITGIQVLSGVMSVLLGVGNLLATLLVTGVGVALLEVIGWVALVVVAIAALVAVWALWGDEIQRIMGVIAEAVVGFWNTFIKPVFDAWNWVIQNVLGPIFLWFYEAIIEPVVNLIVGIFQVLWSIISTIFNMVYQIITFLVAPAFRWLFDEVIGPWWNKNVRPILEAFGDFFMKNVMPKIESFIEVLGKAWNGILDLLRTPIRLGIEYVFNKGLIAAFNWLADQVPGMTKIDLIPIPAALQPGGVGASAGRPSQQAFASGGVLPGYTPGRDVHRFYSPTAGILDLSGGEGIARPEIVRAVGKDRWDAANKAARGGNIGAALGYLGGFADGGVIDWIGDTLDSVTENVGGFFSGLGQALTDPGQWLREILGKAAGGLGFGGPLADAVISMATAPVDSVVNWLHSMLGSGSPDGSITPGGGIGYQAMIALATGLMPGVGISSTLRPGAVTAGYGATSFHALGRAIDLVGPNLMGIFNLLDSVYGSRSQELLYTPAGERQILRGGRRGMPNAVTQANHHDHVHWAMADGGVVPTLYDDGGYLPPGLSLVANKTGRPEPVFTEQQFNDMRTGTGMSISFEGANIGYDPRDVADAIAERRRDELALSGILDEGTVF